MAVIRLFLILSAMLTVPAPLVFADLNVSLLTLEPGPTVFESFGHSAIMIEDSERPELPVIYQYGQTDVRSFWTGKNLLQNLQKLFDQKLTTRPERFESPRLSNGFPKYFDDKLSPLSNRAIIKSALTLSAEQTSRFIEMLDADYRAGAYRYHSFNDNCVTRIRDHLFDDAVLGAGARTDAQDHATNKTRDALLAEAFEQAATLAKSSSVKLMPDEFLSSPMTKLGLAMLGVSKTQFKTADQFRQTMQSLLENLQNNTSLADLVGSQERADKLIASFREYFFGDTLTKENISEYEAMFIPEYLHSAIVRIQSPDEVRIFRNSDGEIQTINLSKPSQSSTL